VYRNKPRGNDKPHHRTRKKEEAQRLSANSAKNPLRPETFLTFA
jgi:hypothetical protein